MTLTLEPGTYHSRWFNPRSSEWVDAPVATGPRWMPPVPAEEGDWALFLRHDPELVDTTPPTPVFASASLARNEILISFSKALDPRSVAANHFTLDPGVAVHVAKPGDEPNTVLLASAPLTAGTRYTLSVRHVRDQAPAPNRLTTPARIRFEVQDATRPIVELRFNEGSGRITANTGGSAHTHPTAALTDQQLAWTTNTPPVGRPGALEFGVQPADRAVEFTGDVLPAFRGLQSFTLSGWVNCRSAQVGSGGNRITTVAYDCGQVGEDLGPLAVGHFNRHTRPGHTDRMFRGLMDEIRIHGSRLDGAGALTLEQIRALQGPVR